MIAGIIGFAIGFILSLGGSPKRSAVVAGYWLGAAALVFYVAVAAFFGVLLLDEPNVEIADILEGVAAALAETADKPMEAVFIALAVILPIVLAVFSPRWGHWAHRALFSKDAD